MKKRVLIAEDHKGTANTYKIMLESENYEVILTGDGEDCIRTFDQYFSQEDPGQREPTATGTGPHTLSSFDVVVLDYQMPFKDGIDVARHILSKAPHQRILIASAYPSQVIARSAETLDRCVELLLKPFDLDEFAEVVERRAEVQIIEPCIRNVK